MTQARIKIPFTARMFSKREQKPQIKLTGKGHVMILYAITLSSQQTPIGRVIGVHVTKMVILN